MLNWSRTIEEVIDYTILMNLSKYNWNEIWILVRKKKILLDPRKIPFPVSSSRSLQVTITSPETEI